MMMRQQHRLAGKAGAQKESWQYRALMAVPRNLVYVFLCVIIGAFLGMIYIVYTEQGLDFFTSTIHHEKVVVHPLFEHFKKIVHEYKDVPVESIETLTSQMFFSEYLSRNIPVHVKDGCQNWPAIDKWSDKTYLEKNFLGQSLLINRLERHNETFDFRQNSVYSRRNNFKDFLNKTQFGTNHGQFMYYIKNEMLVSKTLQQDYQKPTFISHILRNRLTGMTVWGNFVRKSEFKDRERYFCVIDGKEEFKMVSPIYKQNIYSGVYEELDPIQSPVDFFHPNLKEFPLFEEANLMTVEVLKGGCVYVPSFYWLQTRTNSPESTLVTFEYESHNELAGLLFQAIDSGILEE